MRKSIGLAIVLMLCLSSAVVADSIKPGIDAFRTLGGGKTFYDFAKNPVPAGFFCASSATFADRVALKGLPVETGTPGELRDTDTIIERLDDAVFDAHGRAETRIRFRALSMVSVAPIKTSCGAYHVYVTLDGKQPVTKMRIQRTQQGGGNFRAPLAANVRLNFVPVRKDGSRRKLELRGSVKFPGKAIPWSFPDGKVLKQMASAVVDTNGDLKPDTRLPGTSNFTAGYPPDALRSITGTYESCYCTCHEEGGEYHCTMNSSTGSYCDVPPDMTVCF